MNTFHAFLLFLASACSAQQAAVAAGPDVAAELTRRYADQVLLLRHAIPSDSQTYDATGKLLTPGKEGPWTLYAGLHTTRISADARELRIEGERTVFLYDKTKKMLVRERRKDPLQVVIQLAGPLTAADDAAPILQSVFAMNSAGFIKSVPEFWRPYLARERENPRALQQLGLPPAKRKHSWFGVRRKRKVHAVHVGGKTLRPPKTKNPSYNQIARDHGLQGTVVIDVVVDKTGKVLRPVIVQPLGMGLDEKAIKAIKTWRLKPPRKNGQPAKAKMELEISFHLDQ